MCQCPNCEAVRASQGSDSANWVLFVNAIADEVEKKYPDVMIGMFAFVHTESPPKTIKPRKNVLIYSALLARNFLDPISAYAFHADSLKKWGRIASRVYVWNYDANFRNYYYLHPNYFVNGDNMKFAQATGVDGVLVQSSFGTAADLMAMRTWVTAQMMWDPGQDHRQLMAEFLNGYYGAAGSFLMQYIDLLVAAAHRKPNFWISCYTRSTSGWLALEDTNATMGLLDQAAGAVADDERVAKRVWLARRAIDFVWLDRYDELKNEAQAKGMPFLGPSDPAGLVDELAPYANRWGHYKEGSGFPIYFNRRRKKFPTRRTNHH